MRNLEIALCDTDNKYIMRFASYLMEHQSGGIHIFTTTESFYEDEGEYDVALLSEDFKEICDFKSKGKISHKYYLSEDREAEAEDVIYKYQAVDQIMEAVTEFRQAKGELSTKKSNSKSKLIGVYSPITHELQLPFSMALNQAYSSLGRVLFLDLEEISILSNLTGRSCERNFMDLLYEISTNSKDLDLSQYVRSFMDFDYVAPFMNPNELGEIEEDIWLQFFDRMEKADYDTIVVLFGRAINGFARVLGRLEKLFVLGRPGDYFKRSQEIFLDYVERCGLNMEVENVSLPMTAKNLTEGTYQMEELLQGNLGMFVKRLMGMSGQNEYYG